MKTGASALSAILIVLVLCLLPFIVVAVNGTAPVHTRWYLGADAPGDAFISGRSDGVVDMWLDDGTHRQYRLPSDAPEQGALRAVALDGARTLIYGLDFGAWYQGDHIDRRFVVDEPVYRTEIFPHLWGLASSAHTTSGPDGTVVLSTTGPGGLALIGLRWLPENTR